jgi:hypothetical protein
MYFESVWRGSSRKIRAVKKRRRRENFTAFFGIGIHFSDIESLGNERVVAAIEYAGHVQRAFG